MQDRDEDSEGKPPWLSTRRNIDTRWHVHSLCGGPSISEQEFACTTVSLRVMWTVARMDGGLVASVASAALPPSLSGTRGRTGIEAWQCYQRRRDADRR